MSSHTRKLTETLRMIESMKKSLKCTAIDSEYQRGLYNGLEMMRAMLSCQDPEIIEKQRSDKNSNSSIEDSLCGEKLPKNSLYYNYPVRGNED